MKILGVVVIGLILVSVIYAQAEQRIADWLDEREERRKRGE